ncbi:MAG: trypsin-like peptidase domain-containing protein [Chloroflexi bacterium]|nr:trypsin-like peptidase domain-containing protein [Chloroflexota bacterium]
MKTNLQTPKWITSLFLIFAIAMTACGGSVEEIPTPIPVANTVEPPLPTAEPPTSEPKDEDEPKEPEVQAEPEVRVVEPVDLQAATVQIYAKFNEREQLQTAWTGSGTIISEDGFILTNAHVASPLAPGLAALYNDTQFIFGDEPDALVVGIVESADLPPVETYLAEVRAADGVLDLAVIEITHTIDGEPVDASNLNLPYVEIGDSNLLNLGDEIQVYGFPGAGGETITFTRGDVSGFESEERIGTRTWIKTDTTVSPGNSGGLGANAQGQIIGVPSFVREAQGGAINRLRSINFAVPLVEAAKSGDEYDSPYFVDGTGSESLEFVTWSHDFDADTSCAIDEVSTFPSNSSGAVANFEYKGMADGEQIVIAWFFNNEFLTSSVTTWDFGKSGECFATYVHNFGDPIDDGTYDVELYAGRELDLIGSATTTVGGAGTAVSTSSASAIQVEGVVTDADSGKPINEAVVILLNPGTDLDAWLDDPVDEDVYTLAETNGKGAFELPNLLERDIEYPGVVWKEGYQTNEGFLLFDESYSDVVTLELELSK